MSSPAFAAAGVRLADIHITGRHSPGLHQVRKPAFRWAEVAQEKPKMRKG